MARPRKKMRISIEVETELYKNFQDLCAGRFQTVSGRIKAMMQEELEQATMRRMKRKEYELNLQKLERELSNTP